MIYGAPGVGKLTTALALAHLTGFKNFHNHVSFEFAKSIFTFPTPPFLNLMETVRLAAFEAAARARVPGVVFTFVYAAPDDDAFVKNMIRTVEGQGGELAFVRLFCDAAAHELRVVAEGRQRFGKVTTVVALRLMMARSNLAAAIPFRPSLEIDTSTLEPDAVAWRIVRHFSLPTIPSSP